MVQSQWYDFHSHSMGWILPTMWSKNTMVLGESVLVWTMLQLTLQAAWHHTYVWHDKLDQFPAPDSTWSDQLFHTNSISNALWSSQSQHIHQWMQPHAEKPTCCSGQKPKAIFASPSLPSPGKLRCQARQPAPNATPVQGQQLMKNSQQNIYKRGKWGFSRFGFPTPGKK